MKMWMVVSSTVLIVLRYSLWSLSIRKAAGAMPAIATQSDVYFKLKKSAGSTHCVPQ
jgi:hypothetical protein